MWPEIRHRLSLPSQLREPRPSFAMEVGAVRVEEIQQVNQARLDWRQPFTVLMGINTQSLLNVVS